MTRAGPSPETLLKRRIRAIMDVWEKSGRSIGSITVEGDKITLSTLEEVRETKDPFEKWQEEHGDAA